MTQRRISGWHADSAREHLDEREARWMRPHCGSTRARPRRRRRPRADRRARTTAGRRRGPRRRRSAARPRCGKPAWPPSTSPCGRGDLALQRSARLPPSSGALVARRSTMSSAHGRAAPVEVALEEERPSASQLVARDRRSALALDQTSSSAAFVEVAPAPRRRRAGRAGAACVPSVVRSRARLRVSWPSESRASARSASGHGVADEPLLCLEDAGVPVRRRAGGRGLQALGLGDGLAAQCGSAWPESPRSK